jgi:neutral ceramidase
MRVISVCLLAAMSAPAWSQELKVGAAAVTITPPAGIPMAGYYSERGANGVHDELYAKAIVLESGSSTAALVALDLISAPRSLVDDARREIERAAGIPGAHVMISATHSHTGPVLDVNSPFGGQSEITKRYRADLPAKIADAVRLAKSRLTPARALVAHGSESSIAFNRRYHMKDGTVGWNPGKKNPNVVKPAGTIDPDVPLIFFESTEHKPLAAYVNYAVHLDNIGAPLISADMPATLSRCLADFKGPELVTVFTTGCCGDVNHIDVNWGEAQGGFANAARMGTILAGEVLRSWPRLQTVAATSLRVRSEMVSLPLPELSASDEEKARAIITRMNDTGPPRPTFLEMVQALKVRDVLAQHGRPQEVEVQVVALGNDVAWVSLPGEIFTELGLAIKQDSPFPHTIIAELANGLIGYIPSRRAYAQGNYEVVSARCAAGSGERLVDAAVKLLKDLHVEKTAGKSQ